MVDVPMVNGLSGAWLKFLDFLTVFGVFTNLALVILVDKDFKPHWDSTVKVVLFFVLVGAEGTMTLDPFTHSHPASTAAKPLGATSLCCQLSPCMVVTLFVAVPVVAAAAVLCCLGSSAPPPPPPSSLVLCRRQAFC